VESAWARRSRIGLGALLLVTGVLHFVVPAPYVRIIPRLLPSSWASPLVYVSGAFELAGGAALLVAVFPANLQMALDSPNVVTIGRLPLQLPLVWVALMAAIRSDTEPVNSPSGIGRANR
jgi:uncharacterized membrane protein